MVYFQFKFTTTPTLQISLTFVVTFLNRNSKKLLTLFQGFLVTVNQTVFPLWGLLGIIRVFIFKCVFSTWTVFQTETFLWKFCSSRLTCKWKAMGMLPIQCFFLNWYWWAKMLKNCVKMTDFPQDLSKRGGFWSEFYNFFRFGRTTLNCN